MHRRHLLTSFSPLPLLHKGSMKWVDMHIRIKVYNCEKLKKKKEAVLLLYPIKKHSTVSISPVKSKNDSKRKIEKDKLIDTQTYTHTPKKKKEHKHTTDHITSSEEKQKMLVLESKSSRFERKKKNEDRKSKSDLRRQERKKKKRRRKNTRNVKEKKKATALCSYYIITPENTRSTSFLSSKNRQRKTRSSCSARLSIDTKLKKERVTTHVETRERERKGCFYDSISEKKRGEKKNVRLWK